MRREMLTTDFLDRAVDLYGDVTGVVAHDGTEYTYAELGARVGRLANALAERGVEQGDRVALLAPNTHYFIETLYATNGLGAVFVPMNYRLTADELGRTVLEDVRQFAGGQPVVHRHEDGAEFVRRVQRLDEVVGVGRQERHPVAPLDAPRRERVRQAVDPRVEFRVRVLGPVVSDDPGHVAVEVDRPVEKVRGAHLPSHRCPNLAERGQNSCHGFSGGVQIRTVQWVRFCRLTGRVLAD